MPAPARVPVPPRRLAILVLGARGFIGARVAAALEGHGHRVVRGGRPAMDLARDHDPAAWLPRLDGIDLVVNAAGLIAERAGQTFEAVHVRGPVALFEACARRGVGVIQVSALGADEGAVTAFQVSKRRADEALLTLPIPFAVLQPSLVYGEGGASARLFAMLAALPVIPLPGRGTQQVQPVHVDDLAEAVVRLAESAELPRARVAVVGPCGLTLRGFLEDLRRALRAGPPRLLRVPMPLVRLAARTGLGLLDRDTLSMLERGNAGDPARLAAILGRQPRPPSQFVPPERADATRRAAALDGARPLLAAAIAFVWIATGIVSAGVYPVEESLALLARVGLAGAPALAALYGAAALDLALGIATLAMKRRRTLWLLQMAVIAGYSAIITVFLPEQWLHPYGPLTKNVPMLAALWLLYATEGR